MQFESHPDFPDTHEGRTGWILTGWQGRERLANGNAEIATFLITATKTATVTKNKANRLWLTCS
jgi:hypothetical protein